MSGAIGWRGHGPSYDPGPSNGGGGGFSRAQNAYSNPTPASHPGSLSNQGPGSAVYTPPQSPASIAYRPRVQVDLSAKKKLTSTKKNVIIVALDGTGSMGGWREEIRNRCKTLFTEAQGYLGEDLEILFIGFGDLLAGSGDKIEAAPFGDGPVLDDHLMALDMDQAGFGNNRESADMAAYFVDVNVDVSTAQKVYFFVVTDEETYPTIDRFAAQHHLGVDLREPLRLEDLFARLRKKMDTFIVAKKLGDVHGETPRAFWEKIVGRERVLPLDDGRRVVDVMLGVMAKTTNQYQKFSQRLSQAQGNSQYSQVNQQSVHASLMNVPGGPQAPKVSLHTGTKVLVLNPQTDPDPKP